MRDAEGFADRLFAGAFRGRQHPDVVLTAFGCSYPAHRVILASQSTYFDTLLRWLGARPPQPGVGAKGPGHLQQELAGLPSHALVLGEDVTQQGFEWILEYFYASPHVAITGDNAIAVLAAAHYLGVTAVQTACVEFLAQHLDPTNLAACLTWATRADHGEASDMLAAACRRLLALRLPAHLPAWAPALPHIEPRTLLDILSSDHLAVPSEYDRYELVKEVAALFAAAASAPSSVSARGSSGGGAEAAHGGSRRASVDSRRASGESDRAGAAAAAASAAAAAAELGEEEVQRMLSSALHVSDDRLARHLHLSRSCPAVISNGPNSQQGPPQGPAPASSSFPSATTLVCTSGNATAAAAASEGTGCNGGGGGGSGGQPPSAAFDSITCMSPSDCGGGGDGGGGSNIGWPGASSQTSTRSSTLRSFDMAGGGGGGPVSDALPSCDSLSLLGPAEEEDDGAAGLHEVTAAAAGDSGDSQAEAAAGSGAMGLAAAATAVTAATAAAAAASHAEAARLLLLHEAVRYEHLTVSQLMAVAAEGLLAPGVLHAALWERTRLDCAVQARGGGGAVASSSSGAAAGGAGGGAGGIAMEHAPTGAGVVGREAMAGLQQVLVLRPFRMCWRLSCGALKKLRCHDMLQSQQQQYAGALWQVRLCCNDKDAVKGHLGMYVARHLAAAAAAAGPTHGARGPAAHGGAAAASHAQPAAAAPRHHAPQQHRQDHRGRRQPPPPPAPQQQHHPSATATSATPTPPPPPPFFAFADRSPSLRSRCRLSVFQCDNTVLKGRLCLGDTADFDADFAAGGYFGQGKLLARADLAALPDEAEVLAFVTITALAV